MTGSFWGGGPQPELWDNLVDGYLDVDGIRYPDSYPFEGRNGRETETYENVRFNVEPEDEFFVIPDELKQEAERLEGATLALGRTVNRGQE